MRAGRGEQRRTGGLRSRDFKLNPNRAGAVENSHINVCGGDTRVMTSDGVSDPVCMGRVRHALPGKTVCTCRTYTTV